MARPMRSDGTRYPRRRPINWDFVRLAIRHQREKRDLLADGFTGPHECANWKIYRGIDYMDVILDVRISDDRKHLYVKTGPA